MPVTGATIQHIRSHFSGWHPSAIIDIGANVGRWSESAREEWPDSKILMLEASTDLDKKLRRVSKKLGNVEHEIAILSASDGDKVEFFQDGGSTGNSMFKEQTKFFDNIKPTTRTTSKLDTLVSKHSDFFGDTIIDYVKADVQGAELVVFQGAIDTLRNATFVQFEASTIEYNLGGACQYEVDAFLRSLGYYLYFMGDLHTDAKLYKTLGTGQWDALYIRPDSPRLPPRLKSMNTQYCGVGQSRKLTLHDDKNKINAKNEYNRGVTADGIDHASRHFLPRADLENDVSVGWWIMSLGFYLSGVLSTLLAMRIMKHSTPMRKRKTIL